MKSHFLKPCLAIVIVPTFLPGCGSEPSKVDVVLAKKPGFFRIYNASSTPFTTLVNGRNFGDRFAPGSASPMTRMSPKPANVAVSHGSSSPIEYTVPVEVGLGTTLYVFDPTRADGSISIQGDQYAGDKAAARVRAVAIKPTTPIQIEIEGLGPVLPLTDKSQAGEVKSVALGKALHVVAKNRDGEKLAEARLVPEAERSYTILIRADRGKTKLEVLVNNPPLVPVGANQMMSSG